MPIYEYYCPKCAAKFEELRPIARADETAVCAKGHRGASRTLSMVAPRPVAGRDGTMEMPSTGGGCACGGGGCGCGH